MKLRTDFWTMMTMTGAGVLALLCLACTACAVNAAPVAEAPASGPMNPTLTSIEELEVQAFDLRSIVTSAGNTQAGPLGMFPMSSGLYPWTSERDFSVDYPAGAALPEDGEQLIDPDRILEVIHQLAFARGDDDWEDRVRIEMHGSNMIVRAAPEELERVRRALAYIEDWARARVALRVYFLQADESASVPTGIVPAAEWRRLTQGADGVQVLGSYSGTCVADRTTVIGETNEQAYVSDYDVEVAQSASIADPIETVLRTGRQVVVRAARTTSGRISLEVGLDVVHSEGMRRAAMRAANVGDVEVPELEARRLGFHAVIPDGGAVITSFGETGSYAVVTASTAARQASRGRAGNVREGVGFRLLPTRLLTGYHVPFRFRPANLLDDYRRTGTMYSDMGDFSEGEGEEFLAIDSLIELLRENVLRDEGDERETFDAHHDTIVGVSSEARLDAVENFLVGLESLRDRNVSIGLSLYHVEGEGRDARSLADREAHVTCQITALHGSGAAVVVGREHAFVKGYDVEIAQSAQIADPAVLHCFSGLALNLTPLVDQAGKSVTVRMAGELSHFEMRGESSDFGAPYIGGIDLPERTRLAIQGDPTLRVGESRVIDIRSDDDASWVLLLSVDLP